MARQRLAPAAQHSVNCETSDAFERAQQAATRRFTMRPLPEGATSEMVNRQVRESIEIGEMFQRVRRDAAANGRGWTWHLLHVLDWNGDDVEVNERLFRKSLGHHDAQTASQIAKSHREQDESLKARGARLRTLRDLLARTAPDLRWGALQNVASAHRESLDAVLDDQLAQFDGLINEAIAAHDAYEKLLAQLDGMHGRNRVALHVKGAALVALAELHGLLDDVAWKAHVADLVVMKNAEFDTELRPSKTYVNEDEIREKIRKLLNVCRV